MTIMTLLEFAGMDRQAYDRLGASLQAQGAPAGILFHSCGAVPNGWRIVDAWRSQEDFDHFVDETLLPAARSLGIPAPARREHFHAYHAGMVAPGACRARIPGIRMWPFPTA